MNVVAKLSFVCAPQSSHKTDLMLYNTIFSLHLHQEENRVIHKNYKTDLLIFYRNPVYYVNKSMQYDLSDFARRAYARLVCPQKLHSFKKEVKTYGWFPLLMYVIRTCIKIVKTILLDVSEHFSCTNLMESSYVSTIHVSYSV